MIDKIKCNRRIGNDIHKELIALFNQLQTGWKPPMHITEDEYNNVRLNRNKYPDYYVGFVGFNATFGNKYFGGYARSPKSDGDRKRDRPNESIRNMMEQVPNIQNVKFVCDDYLTLNETNMNNWVIYCDPPYQGTTKYATDGFEYDIFWQWVRDTSKHNFVFVSEYNAPEDFECIWSKECKVLIDNNRTANDKKNIRVEKLFTYNRV